MNDAYLRTAAIFLPKIHGIRGLVNKWGIATCPVNNGDTQREEATFAKMRKKIAMWTTHGGFKPNGHRAEHSDESIHRELAMRADCESRHH